jgi:hypothetical protein
MVETHDHFINRLSFLGRKHAKMTQGYTTKVNKDGLIVVRPKAKRRGFPLKGLILTVLGFFAFKALMLVAAGPTTYTERLSKLENGTVIELAGAKVLGIDPVTQAMADAVSPLLR